MRNLVLVTLLLLCAPCLPAQLLRGTLPMGHEWIELGGSTEVPFGLSQGRLQQVWPTEYVQGPQVMALFGLAVRRDGNTGAAAGAFSVECELAFSSTAATPGTLSATFAANQGPDHTLVLNRRQLAFPATTLAGLKPEPFLAPILFDRPFMFNKGLSPAGLLWEARVFSATGSPGTGLALDAFTPNIARVPPWGKSAPGCPALLAGKPLDLQASFSATNPPTLTLTLKEAPPLTPVVIYLGLDASRFGGLPLPIDLTPLGMPGCSFYVNPLVPVAGTSNAQGGFTQAIPVPATVPSPRSFPFYAQAFSPAPGVNPFGLAASNGACGLTTSNPQAGRVLSRLSPDALQGTVENMQGVVLEILRN